MLVDARSQPMNVGWPKLPPKFPSTNLMMFTTRRDLHSENAQPDYEYANVISASRPMLV